MSLIFAVIVFFVLTTSSWGQSQDGVPVRDDVLQTATVRTQSSSDQSSSDQSSSDLSPANLSPSDQSPSDQSPADQLRQTTESEQVAAQVAHLTHYELAPVLDGKESIKHLLQRYLSVLNHPDEVLSDSERGLKQFAIRREVQSLLATEGYFLPQISFELRTSGTEGASLMQTEIIHLQPGLRTEVSSVDIHFAGTAVPAEVQETIRKGWKMPVGVAFRDDLWNQAKIQALDGLTEVRYAAAKISVSEAKIQDLQAELTLELDSGPPFFIGDMNIEGLNRYQPWLLESYHPPIKGEPYSRERLMKFQRELQNSPYFSSVSVSLDPDPDVAAAVPVDVVVKERASRDFGLGAGVSSNTGARGELSYRDRDFTGRAYDLRSVVRIEQLRQIGYADIYLPPRHSGYLDSFGVLVDRSNISGLQTTTSSFGAKRSITENQVERRLSLSFVNEKNSVSGGDTTYARALVGSIGRTWRDVDNSFAPRKGSIAQLDISAADRGFLSDQRFLRLYGKVQYWLPAGKRDGFIFRAEMGNVISTTRDGIPEEYLFRAGGTNSVRGFAYQSIGIDQDNGVVGGRVLATASAEYVHWVGADWGVACFMDVGDAACYGVTPRIT